MTQELQELLEKIKREGVDKARSEADEIVTQAREQAKRHLEDAKQKADKLRREAERDAQAFEQRAEQSLRQAARDLLLQVEKSLITRCEQLLRSEVDQSLADEARLTDWISKAVTAYLKDDGSSIEVVLGGQAAAQAEGLRARLRQEAAEGKGVEIRGDTLFPNGFSLRLAEGRIEHTFTSEAITEALSRLLRPQLAALFKPEDGKGEPSRPRP